MTIIINFIKTELSTKRRPPELREVFLFARRIQKLSPVGEYAPRSEQSAGSLTGLIVQEIKDSISK